MTEEMALKIAVIGGQLFKDQLRYPPTFLTDAHGSHKVGFIFKEWPKNSPYGFFTFYDLADEMIFWKAFARGLGLSKDRRKGSLTLLSATGLALDEKPGFAEYTAMRYFWALIHDELPAFWKSLSIHLKR